MELKNILLYKFFYNTAVPTLAAKSVLSMDAFVQHGNTSCLMHCIAVAYYSYIIASFLKLKCDRKSLIRGALLHDYYLYDWHDKDLSHRLHGFRHNKTALKNAKRDFVLNNKEENIIDSHMFPLVPVVPKCKESILVSLVDKVCSTYEVFGRNTYKGRFFSDVCKAAKAENK